MPWPDPVSITIPCNACCGEKCYTFECSTRGGDVKLCGWDEFGEPSVPPRYYLEKALAGSAVICDYHSVTPGSTCEDDECVSPVGWSITGSAFWNCSPEHICLGLDTGGTVRMEVVSVAAGSPGNVDITFAMYQPAPDPQCSPTAWSYSGLLNATLFMYGLSSSAGTIVTTVSRPDGTTLGFSLITAVACSPAATFTFVKCTGDGGEDCETEFVSGASSTGVSVSGLEFCVPRKTSVRYKYSGAAIYDPAIDCDDITTDTRQRETIDQPFGCNPATSGGFVQATTTAFEPALTFYVEEGPASNNTFKEQVSTDACVNDKKCTECDRNEILNSEDTDEDAIVRLLANPTTGTWSEYQVVDDGAFGSCANPECCLARWQIREGRIFVYREARYRAIVIGLVPTTSVDIAISMMRRPFNDGLYSLFQIVNFTATANHLGIAEVTGLVPNAEGFDTYASTCTYEPSS